MLSLSHREGKNVVLSTNKQYQEYILAAKFLTKRSVNIDAVEKTFRRVPLKNLILEMLGNIISCLLLKLSRMLIRF